jgi:enterochelin esterase family protein
MVNCRRFNTTPNNRKEKQMTQWIILAVALLFSFAAFTPQETQLTPKSLQAALQAKPRGSEAEKLAEQVRAWFGKDISDLSKGAAPKIDDLTVAWAIEVPEAKSAPRVSSQDAKFVAPLNRIGNTNVYAAVAEFPWGTAFRWRYEIGEQKLVVGRGELEVYTTPPEARKQPGVPEGKLIQQPKWASKIFEGTTRDWWVYVPAQYRAESPACVMVFQDGQNAKNYVPVVFNNLIAKGDMPVTVGIFISPGTRADGRPNRSFEYDTLSDQYARFLLEEILPEVEKTYILRHDPMSRAIGGISSGGICAFTVAWSAPQSSAKSSPGSAASPTLPAGRLCAKAGTITRRWSARRRRNRSASSCRTAKTIWTMRMGTGRWRTRRWPKRWPSPNTISSLNGGTVFTATGTGARSCPTACAGCGGTTRRISQLNENWHLYISSAWTGLIAPGR